MDILTKCFEVRAKEAHEKYVAEIIGNVLKNLTDRRRAQEIRRIEAVMEGSIRED